MTTILGVTGTGTGIGKTALSGALLLSAQHRGLRTAYHKPVQCGASPLPDGHKEGGDADGLAAKLGNPFTFHNSISLKMAASPHLAAEKEGIRLNADSLLQATLALAANHDCVILEGAGGAAVPFSRQGWGVLRIAPKQTQWIVAAAPGLGTLHHTIATVAWMRDQGAKVAGFALVHTESADSALSQDNRDTLMDLLDLPCLAELPFLPAWNEPGALSEGERRLWRQALDAGAKRLWRV